MIKLKSIFLEGMYDRLSGLMTDLVWMDIHSSYRNYLKDPEENDISMFRHKIKFQENIIFEVIIKRTKKNQGSKVDANTADDGSEIALFIEFGIKSEPGEYNEINARINETLRHELEHIQQKKGNSEVKPTDAELRAIANKDPFQYFTLKDEIPAMVHGFYKKAKMKRNWKVNGKVVQDYGYIDDEMENYLRWFVKRKQITKEQMIKIMKIWINAAKRLVPNAKYSHRLIKE